MSTDQRTDLSELIKLAAEGKKSIVRRGKWERFWVFVLVRVMLAPLDGWLLMLGAGVVHAQWIPSLPTIGYWWAVVVMLIAKAIWPPQIPRGTKS